MQEISKKRKETNFSKLQYIDLQKKFTHTTVFILQVTGRSNTVRVVRIPTSIIFSENL